jgi:hypothetical protein
MLQNEPAATRGRCGGRAGVWATILRARQKKGRLSPAKVYLLTVSGGCYAPRFW